MASWTETLQTLRLRGDVAFSMFFFGVVLAFVAPVSAGLLDVLLTFSLAVSFVVLLTVLFVQKPVEFSAFPTTLLAVTLLRLSLNVASSRLILSHGSEGIAAAGDVIRAFGIFLMKDNYIIGLIVFCILMIINFSVITKGSGRIAEVAARFSLDALPGKQLAIDSELSTGMITQDEAKTRRKDMQEETNFYGAMDGASKFVRGDAVAGVIILAINLIGGVAIGMLQGNLSFGHAVRTYAFLTIGDGLVTQIPALVVSIAAGVLVSRGATEGSADRAVFRQLGANPVALGLGGGLLFLTGLLPSMPKFPFFALAFGLGAAWWFLSKAPVNAAKKPSSAPKTFENVLKTTLNAEALSLNVGEKTLTNLPFFVGRMNRLRTELGKETGVLLPGIPVDVDPHLAENAYVLKVHDVAVLSASVELGKNLAINVENAEWPFQGATFSDPIFQLPSRWIPSEDRKEAEHFGFVVLSADELLMMLIKKVFTENLSELFSFAELQDRVQMLSAPYQKLYQDMVPGQISVGVLHKILRKLLAEKVSVVDFGRILESVQEGLATTQAADPLVELVRVRLGRRICQPLKTENGTVPALSLGEHWERTLRETVMGDANTRHLAIAPSVLDRFCKALRDAMGAALQKKIMPVLVVGSDLRRPLRDVLERFFPSLTVLAHSEIPSDVQTTSVGTLAA